MLGSPANVTYKIQYKCPDFNFSKAFYKLSNQNIPMAEILSELKKGNADSYRARNKKPVKSILL